MSEEARKRTCVQMADGRPSVRLVGPGRGVAALDVVGACVCDDGARLRVARVGVLARMAKVAREENVL